MNIASLIYICSISLNTFMFFWLFADNLEQFFLRKEKRRQWFTKQDKIFLTGFDLFLFGCISFAHFFDITGITLFLVGFAGLFVCTVVGSEMNVPNNKM